MQQHRPLALATTRRQKETGYITRTTLESSKTKENITKAYFIGVYDRINIVIKLSLRREKCYKVR